MKWDRPVLALLLLATLAGCGTEAQSGQSAERTSKAAPQPATTTMMIPNTTFVGTTTNPAATVPATGAVTVAPTVADTIATTSAGTGDTIGEPDPEATSTLPPPAGPVHGALAAWDMCMRSGPMQVIDPDTGAVLTTVALAGRPAWSPDGRRLASLDNSDGAVRVADIATGVVRTVADMHVPPFAGDDCNTSGRVDWSPDGNTLLVTHSSGGNDATPTFVGVVRVDAPEQATLHAQSGPVAARWLSDGEVMIVAVSADGAITIEHAMPWDSWPPAAQTLTVPALDGVGLPTISPDGSHLAFAVYGSPAPAPTGGNPANQPQPTGAVVVVDVASGHSDTIDHYAAAAVSFSPDSSRIGFVGADYQLVVVAAGSTTPSYTGPFGGYEVSWAPDGRSVATSLAATIQRLDLPSGTVHELSGSGGLWVTQWEPT